jgi:hypothetical protein
MNHNTVSQILGRHHDFVDARPLVEVRGLSSPRVCNLLNALVRELDPSEAYLEIGTWQGLTLLSAALGNFGRTCIGCDKFRFYGRFTGWGLGARRALLRNIRRYRGYTADIHFHHTTAARLFAERRVSTPVGLYFYDADHSYRGTRHGIEAAAPFLADRCLVILDDWNDPIIRRATHDGLEAAHLRRLWQGELGGDQTERGFWNGLGLFYVEKEKAAARLDRSPPVVDSALFRRAV